jgi:Fe-S cluster assembly protein SufD
MRAEEKSMQAVSTEGVTSAFNRDAVESQFDGQPEWLRLRRLEAWAEYERTPLPTRRLEEWRYTDPKQLRYDEVGLAVAPAAPAAAEPARMMLAGREASARITQIGASIVDIELDEELSEKGVIVTDLATAARDHEALVREHYGTRAMTPDTGKFAALNDALWTAGVFVYVPRGVHIEKPIRVARWIGEAGVGYFMRTLIVAAEGSRFGFVEEFSSPDFEQPVFSCGGVEIVTASAAHVQYVAMQRYGTGVRHIATQRTVAARDANLHTLNVNLGGEVARVDLAATMNGPGARSEMLGLYFADGDQHFDHNTRQNHKVPHATSDLLYKGALDGRGRAVFRGIIKVFPGAQRTDAYQTNRNLILSRQAEATALPNLEIEADDVRCSHAATVGHLDKEELFYIMSRGVPRKDAERLVVFGFFGEVLERLPLPGVVEELRAAIEEKIG